MEAYLLIRRFHIRRNCYSKTYYESIGLREGFFSRFPGGFLLISSSAHNSCGEDS